MSAATSNPWSIAYLAQGKIRLKAGSEAPRTIESVYGNSVREKAVRAQQKHSWKSDGNDGSPFSGPTLWGKAAAPNEIPLAITSICGGKEPGGLVYSLESGVKELTECDSFDTAPRWRPGTDRRIIFQSAGIGRNREGQFLALGPFSIQQLELEAGELSTLVEHPHYDYLAPQCQADGTLLYIRRPYSAHAYPSLLRVLKDVVLFPFRLAYAVFHYLNFFSAIYTGRKLTSASGAKGREMDLKQMMIWGNLVRSQQSGNVEETGADLVPKTWQLFRHPPNGVPSVLASGVLAYDLSSDGTVVYTNGNAVFLLHPDGRKEHLVTEGMIEQVFFASAVPIAAPAV